MAARNRTRDLLRRITLALLAGIGLGVFELWQFELSWIRFLAAIAAGIVFACSIGLVLKVFRNGGVAKQLAVVGVAGALAGIAWWSIAGTRPFSWAAAVMGAILAWFLYLANGGWQHDESQAA